MPVFEEPHVSAHHDLVDTDHGHLVQVVGVGLAIIASGIPVYAVFIRWTRKPAWLRKGIVKMDNTIQKLFYAVPEDSHQE